ncbi:hypothetical protein [Prevotella falsenii]|uniref:hypothetical protein n=1 Tax=Prevotella falsenii TaxID=515414 RepID=UPI00046893EF|nr:hypothetical protein [Prevotella falsenii]
MKEKAFVALAACCIATTSLAQDSWLMKVRMKSGEVKEIPCNDVEEITFDKKEVSTYYADVKATNTYNIYYGTVKDNIAAYTIHLCDGNLSKGGLPTEINKHDIRLTVMAAASKNADKAALPAGTYSLVENVGEAGIYRKQSVYIETNKVNDAGQVDGFLDSLKMCTLNVEQKADGTYQLLVEGELREHGRIRFAYDGNLTFVNKAQGESYNSITENVAFAPKSMSGRYVRATDNYCDYALSFLNCEVDGEGFIVGAGDYINLVLLTKYAVPMDINTIVGTYDVVMPVGGAVYEQGKYIGGMMYKRSGRLYPMGSFYKVFDGEGYEAYGFFSGGSITVTLDNGNITFKGNWTTPEGKAVTMNYTTDASGIIDQSGGQGNAKEDNGNAPRSLNGATPDRRLHINDIENADSPIFMMKR